MGKGDNYRSVDAEKFSEGFDTAFGKRSCLTCKYGQELTFNDDYQCGHFANRFSTGQCLRIYDANNNVCVRWRPKWI